MCRCTFERPRAGGAARCGCAPRRATCRCSAPAAGRTVRSRVRRHAVASMHAEAGGHALRSANAPPAAPEVAAFLLGERELDARADAAAARQLMLVATPRVEDSGLRRRRTSRRSAARRASCSGRCASSPPRPSCRQPLQHPQLWQSRLPVRDAERELLADFPPPRHARVGPKLPAVDAIPPEGGGDDADAAAPPTPTSAASAKGPSRCSSTARRPRATRTRASRSTSARRSPLLALAAHRGAGLGVDYELGSAARVQVVQAAGGVRSRLQAAT